MTRTKNKKTAIQLCHGYKMPFFDVAQQYTYTLQKAGYHVITIFLTGPKQDEIEHKSFADETLFFELTSKQLKGLKIGLLKKFNHICTEVNVDLIVAHRAKAIYLSCISSPFRHKTMIIGVAHAYNVFKRKNRKVLAYISQKQLRLVGVSNAIRDDIRQSLPLFPQQHIQTFYNRFDFDNAQKQLLSRENARKKLGISQEEYALVNIGRLHPDKDQKTLISAYVTAHKHFNEQQKHHLYIIGAGKLEAPLKQQIETLKAGSFITLIGIVPEAWTFLRAFDGFALSSDHEPFGMVLLEAIAAKLPIISTNCGGAAEINQSAFTFKVGDVYGLSKLLLKMNQATPTEKEKLLEADRQYADKTFSFSRAQQDFEILLNQFN